VDHHILEGKGCKGRDGLLEKLKHLLMECVTSHNRPAFLKPQLVDEHRLGTGNCTANSENLSENKIPLPRT